jgi:hypothetical protein
MVQFFYAWDLVMLTRIDNQKLDIYTENIVPKSKESKRQLLFSAVLVCSLYTLFAACGEQLAQWDGIIEERDGFAFVKSPSEPLHPELKITFTEELSIGVVDGDENYMFGNRILVNTDEEGIFYVSDVDRQIVNTYDTNGHFLQSMGGPGQGPGEFQTISRVRFDGEGNIYLWDGISQRISFLGRNGEYLRGFRPEMYTEEILINKNGYYIAKSVDNVELKGSKKWDYFYGLFDERFKLIVEYLRQPQESGNGGKGGSHAQVLADWLSGMAFQPQVVYALGNDDRLYFGYSENYKIEVYSPEGILQRIIQREFEPMPISSRDKDTFKENRKEQLRDKMPVSIEREVFELVEYPKFKPAYERFVLMENGWLFVIVEIMPSSAALIDIFDQEGIYLGQFEIDIPTEQLFFNNGKGYTIAAIDDYEYVKRYRFEITGLGSGGSEN